MCRLGGAARVRPWRCRPSGTPKATICVLTVKHQVSSASLPPAADSTGKRHLPACSTVYIDSTVVEEVLGSFTYVKVAMPQKINTLTQVKVMHLKDEYLHLNILKVPKVKGVLMQNGPFHIDVFFISLKYDY